MQQKEEDSASILQIKMSTYKNKIFNAKIT
jgi:hypothetical protein